MRRTSRRLIAALTIFGLLFSQGAMAAHACKVQFDSLGGLVDAATSAHSEDCARMMEKAAAPLCFKHCTQGTDASNTVSTTDVPSITLTAFLVVEPAATPLPAESTASLALTARDTSAPLLLLSHRLRI